MASIAGKWALVTGASSGIGLDIARDLAKRGANVVVVARREQRLQEAAAELRSDHKVQTEVEVLDLMEDGAPTRLFESLKARGRVIDILVNNAGYAYHGEFLDQDLDRLRGMISIQILNLVEMTHVFGRAMAERGGGHILQVASVAGMMPVPSYAVYGATKAFVLSFSDAISWEMRERGVYVTAVVPGATWTEFFDVSGQEVTLYNRVTGMDSGDVARIGVNAMLRKRGSVIAGVWNNIGVGLMALVPRRFKSWFAWQLNKTR